MQLCGTAITSTQTLQIATSKALLESTVGNKPNRTKDAGMSQYLYLVFLQVGMSFTIDVICISVSV